MLKDKDKSRVDYIYMAVTADKYELPVAVGNTARELGAKLGISADCVRNREHMNRRAGIKRLGRITGVKIIKVELEEGTNAEP